MYRDCSLSGEFTTEEAGASGAVCSRAGALEQVAGNGVQIRALKPGIDSFRLRRGGEFMKHLAAIDDYRGTIGTIVLHCPCVRMLMFSIQYLLEFL